MQARVPGSRWAVSAALFLTFDLVAHAADQASRGEYLARRVAMCVQCHSPRGHDGSLIEAKLFQGAPIPLESLPAGWAIRAPRISNLPGGWSKTEFIQFLQTGVRPDGSSPERPMPPFRMNRDDASDIAAYLESLR